jgi:diguanylate cyclase (GGDEF)-like protein
MTYAERLLARHKRGGKPLCLVLFDIDQFKALNDRFGHIGGDEILTRFVAITEANLRPDDFLFRLGGDEFCWLLPDTNIADGCETAERVCDGIADSVMVVAGAPVKLTASMGVASTETFGYALDPLMREADTALYAAKAAGRNRVAAAMPRPAAEAGSRPRRGSRVALGGK